MTDLAAFALQLVMVAVLAYEGREVCEEVQQWRDLPGGGRVSTETEEVCTGGVFLPLLVYGVFSGDGLLSIPSWAITGAVLGAAGIVLIGASGVKSAPLPVFLAVDYGVATRRFRRLRHVATP